jgi:hypothetical protein
MFDRGKIVKDHRVIGGTRWISNPASGYKGSFFRHSFYLFFFASSLLFFFQSTLATHHDLFDLYTTSLNDERRVTLSSSACPSLAYHD